MFGNSNSAKIGFGNSDLRQNAQQNFDGGIGSSVHNSNVFLFTL